MTARSDLARRAIALVSPLEHFGYRFEHKGETILVRKGRAFRHVTIAWILQCESPVAYVQQVFGDRGPDAGE